MPVGLGQLLPGHHLGGHPVPHTGALAALGAGPHPGLGRGEEDMGEVETMKVP